MPHPKGAGASQPLKRGFSSQKPKDGASFCLGGAACKAREGRAWLHPISSNFGTMTEAGTALQKRPQRRQGLALPRLRCPGPGYPGSVERASDGDLSGP